MEFGPPHPSWARTLIGWFDHMAICEPITWPGRGGGTLPGVGGQMPRVSPTQTILKRFQKKRAGIPNGWKVQFYMNREGF